MKINIFLVICMSTIGALSSCNSPSHKEEKNTVVHVNAYYPTLQNDNDIFISGQVSAKQTAMISTRVMGYIEKIYVNPGDVVKSGQLLVVINSSDIKAKKAQAQAMLTEASAAVKNARRDYERYKSLFAQKSVSSKELENVELNKVSMESKQLMARQQINEINSMLAYTNIRAPFNGVVTQKMADEGSTTNPGMPIMTIEQSGAINIQASVPEVYIQYVHEGSLVDIDIKSLNKHMRGVITELSPSASLSGGQYNIKISINDKKGLKPGMYAGIHIKTGKTVYSESKIMINQSSVVDYDQLTGVYVVGPDSTALLHWVRLGKKVGNQVEVLSGLNEGEMVIEKGNGKLYNGAKLFINK